MSVYTQSLAVRHDNMEWTTNEQFALADEMIATIQNQESQIASLERIRMAAISVDSSGVLCAPGCCSPDCGCEPLRDALDAHREKYGE